MSPCIRLVRVLTVFITLLGQYVGASPLHMIEPSGSDLVQVESHVVATRQGGGELLELTAEIVEIGAHAIADLVGKKVDQDHDKMSAFTQSTAAQMSKNWPNKNVMVVHGSHDQNFVDEVHSHHELDIIVGGTIGYEIYVFTSGDFTLHSDGGYINWCFMGNFQRGDGGYVKFDPIQDAPTPVPQDQVPQPSSNPQPNQTPAPAPDSAVTPAAPVRYAPGGQGIYLLNCYRGSEASSGVAFYWQLRDGGNWGQRPDDYVDVTHGSLTDFSTAGSVVFPSTNTKFSWSGFDNTGGALADYAAPGVANNGYVNFWIYKDKPTNNLLYSVDGWDCYSQYWGF